MTHNSQSAGFRQVIGGLIRFSLPLILSGILQQLYAEAISWGVGLILYAIRLRQKRTLPEMNFSERPAL